MRRRLSTRLCRYEPRLLSRSTTILKPSSKTCCSIVSRTFDAAIGFSASLFGVRFRVEGVSARTGAILIRDRNLLRERGQRLGGGTGTSICLAHKVQDSPVAWGNAPGVLVKKNSLALKARFTSSTRLIIIPPCRNRSARSSFTSSLAPE